MPRAVEPELEIALARAQDDPLWNQELGLPQFGLSASVPTLVLETLERMFGELKRRGHIRAETPRALAGPTPP